MRAELATSIGAAQAQRNRWSEFIADLWTTHLPHLREETCGDGKFDFDPSTNRYGFEDQSDYSSDDELFKQDLESDVEDMTQPSKLTEEDLACELYSGI